MYSENCKNCNKPLNGKFCSDCGQKADTHRLSLKHIFHEFSHAITHADKGILFLIKELLYKPGIVAREYVAGKRKRYFNPFSFMIIVTAISSYFAYKTHYFAAVSQTQQMQNSGNTQGNYVLYMQEALKLIEKGGKITHLLMVPVLALLMWLFFRKSNYNYAENLTLTILLFTESMVIFSLIFIPHFYFFPAYAIINNNIFQVLFLIYLAIGAKQFYGQSWGKSILKIILIQVIFILVFWLILFSVVAAKFSITG